MSFTKLIHRRPYASEIPDDEIAAARARLRIALADGIDTSDRIDVWALHRAHPDSAVRTLAGKTLQRYAPKFLAATKRAVNGYLGHKMEPESTAAMRGLAPLFGNELTRAVEAVFVLCGMGLQYLFERGGASATLAMQARLHRKSMLLGSNQLQHETDRFDRLPRQIATFKGLVELNMVGCRCKELPDEIGVLYKLRTLDLTNNRITTLPATFAKLVTLEELSLAGNQLRRVPSPLAELASLRSLNLANNRLDQADVARLAQRMPRCQIET